MQKSGPVSILSIIAGANDGCTHYRLAVPGNYISRSDYAITEYHPFINKYSFPPFNFPHPSLKRLNGSLWDQMKWLERLVLLYKKTHFDYLWINRSVLNYENSIDRSISNIIYDFDDAVWLADAQHCFENYCKKASVVLAGNQFLFDHARKLTSKVEIIPTSVDLNKYYKTDTKKSSFNVGWLGSSSGFHYLKRIENQLLIFFSKHADARLIIVSDKYPHELTQLDKFIDYFPWSRSIDTQLINMFSVGLMPITDTVWDQGKCSFKMLQYMACEVPVIASDIGMNKEVSEHMKFFGKCGLMISNDDDWCAALETYYHTSDTSMSEIGRNGREIINNSYSTTVIAKKIETAFSKHL
jgi:glycosyltransferase involved in cell wall biosynthesis